MKWNKKLTSIFAKNAIKQFRTTNPCTPTKRIPSNRGYRADLGCIHDSSMEANVHRFYKYISRKYGKIEVQYEPRGFKFESNDFNIRYYIPDFEICSGQMVWYVEVKGYMDNSACNKATLISRCYPGVKIYYIFPKQYKLIKENYAHLIPNWE